MGNRRCEFERDHVLLLGDAAGLADSIYGEGIYFALKSAHVAAEALAAGFDRPSDRAYSNLIRVRIQRDLTYSELSARLLFRAPKLAFDRMVRNRHVNDYYAELIAGGVGYAECFYKTILTSPYWMFSSRVAKNAESPF